MSLPKFDPSKPKQSQGLYDKFIVMRTDGSDCSGGKHHGCEYFVLDVTHDPHARPALEAYAAACVSEYPQLAADIAQHHNINPKFWVMAIVTAYEQGVGKGHQAFHEEPSLNPYRAGECQEAWRLGYVEGQDQAERMSKQPEAVTRIATRK